jgi:hypothetical protein
MMVSNSKLPLFLGLLGSVVSGFLQTTVPASAGGRFISFEVPGAGRGGMQGTFPEAINDSGTVVGFYIDKNSGHHGFARTSDGNVQTIKINQLESDPRDINRKGFIAGSYYDRTAHGFRLASDGHIQTFDAVDDPSAATEVGGINGGGAIAGYYFLSNGSFHGFLRENKTITLVDAPGSVETEAYKVNDSGVMVGECITSVARRGFIRDAAGSFTLLDAPGAGDKSGTGTVPLNINSGGAVVGLYIDNFVVSHGFLRTTDGVFTSIDPSGAGTGFGEGTEAHNINNKGVIAGTFIDNANVSHGYFRTAAGKITAFDAPHAGTSYGTGTIVLGLNDHGAIAGWTVDDNFRSHGFIRD